MKKLKYDEGTTPIDPDETDGLLLTHITTRGELNRWEQDNITEAMAWLDQAKPKKILNEPFTRKLHKRMFGDAWKWAGQFRKSDKNIGVPWYEVSTELKKLCDDANVWIECRTDPPDEIAVRFHHRLVSIHPFPNGNGRHARLMADILLENVLHCPRFTWGDQDLSADNEVRRQYIEALRAADNLDYRPLLEFARA
ncbi:MAG: mobile mystery protein B [Pseudomonadota bacterium]